jgi:hypothetical protein
MNNNMRLVFLISLIILTLVKFSSGQTPDIATTIDYINQISAEKGRYYPYFQIKSLTNGELIIEHYFCSDSDYDEAAGDYYYKYGNIRYSSTHVKELLTQCDTNTTQWMMRERIILEKLLLPEANDRVPRFKLQRGKGPKISLQPFQLWDADKVIYFQWYNFKTEEYDNISPDSPYCFYFLGDDYSYEKLKNALNHLLSLIAASPELYTRNIRDSDPFAPHNYNK